ncbi:MAG: T9SS type A sorting domain-containing protein, partial [Chitinophagaceae bacterium]
FHTRSYDAIVAYSTAGTGNSCPVTSNTGNGVPTVNAGANYTIPISTPFKLTGSGSDPDGDPLTYCWEEFDLGPAGPPNVSTTTGPIFRSFNPVTSTSRTFPKLLDILNNTTTKGEILPSIARTMTFRLTARDNRAGGGGVNYAAMTLDVSATAGPFAVTSPNSAVSWCPGAHTITWSVNNSNTLAANVNILLSMDGGNTFPVTLKANTPNDGSESVDISCGFSTSARIKVEAVGNVFFDISNANFTVGDNTKPTFTVPANKIIYKDANCNYNASTMITGDVTDEADNCDNTLDATVSEAIAPGSCVGETVITRTWTLTDDCNNSTVKVQTITIKDNTPPTFTVPTNKIIYKDANCNYDASTIITGDVTDEADNCDNTLDATASDAIAPGSCVGETVITRTWTLTDDCNNSTVKVQTITIKDITPPTFTAPANTTIYKDDNCNHDASVSKTGDVTDEADNCDNTLDATFSDVNTPGSCIGELFITRTWSLTDDCGNNTMHTQLITVKDTTRPVISGENANPSSLWPPNHKMVDVTIGYNVHDNCSPISAITNMLTVSSNEPENGLGDGDTAPDWIIIDEHHIKLRAERSGNGNGRIYTITIKSTDDCGNVATKTVTVTVPHSKSNPLTAAKAVDDSENLIDALQLKALPNPSSGNFTLQVRSSNSEERILLTVFDLYGRTVETRIIESESATLSIGKNYMPGVYFVRILQGEKHKELKLIKLSN